MLRTYFWLDGIHSVQSDPKACGNVPVLNRDVTSVFCVEILWGGLKIFT